MFLTYLQAENKQKCFLVPSALPKEPVKLWFKQTTCWPGITSFFFFGGEIFLTRDQFRVVVHSYSLFIYLFNFFVLSSHLKRTILLLVKSTISSFKKVKKKQQQKTFSYCCYYNNNNSCCYCLLRKLRLERQGEVPFFISGQSSTCKVRYNSLVHV